MDVRWKRSRQICNYKEKLLNLILWLSVTMRSNKNIDYPSTV